MSQQNGLNLHWLDPHNPAEEFPPVTQALQNPDGLLAVGGDLSVNRLLRAYRHGIFPWFNPDEPILWWSPDPRAVLVPNPLHVSRSLKRCAAKTDYAVSLDRAFEQVLQACAHRPGLGTWLGQPMQAAYTELHRQGYAHSIEVWRAGELIGGLYGIALGSVFFGESMFSRADNGSKLALLWLCRQLDAWNFKLLDCQVKSPHLQRMGVQLMSRRIFSKTLAANISEPLSGGEKWQFGISHPAGAEHYPAPAH